MTTTDLKTIIAARDNLQQLAPEDGLASRMLVGAWSLLNEVIMQQCPHDPVTYTVEPLDGVLEGNALVTCPACRASVIWPN